MKKNLIITGHRTPKEWEFRKGMEDQTGEIWQIKSYTTNKYNGINKLTRYIKYFFAPIGILKKRERYGNIVTWDQFYGLMLAFYARLFRIKDMPNLYTMAFIYIPKQGIIGAIYEWFVRFAVRSNAMTKLIVYSDDEVETYANRFRVTKDLFASEIIGIEDVANQYGIDISREKYYIAPGRSNRDYQFLIKSWDDNWPKLKIVCDVVKEGFRDIHGENIKILSNCHGEKYFEELAGSYGVIVPLDRDVSSGQLVLEQAAMFGKPVIVTQNTTIEKYVENGQTGIVIEKTKTDLKNAIDDLDDGVLYQKISLNARKKFENDFQLYEMGKRIGEIVYSVFEEDKT